MNYGSTPKINKFSRLNPTWESATNYRNNYYGSKV